MKEFFKKINWNKILFAFMGLVILCFLIFVFVGASKMIPLKYMLLIIGIFVIWLVVLFFLLVFKTKKGKNKPRKIIGYIISIILVVIMGFVFNYLSATLKFIGGFDNKNYSEENYQILVLKDSNYNKIDDLKDKNIGHVPNELTKVKEAVTKLQDKVKHTDKEYPAYDKLMEDLIAKKVDAVMVEELYLKIFEENGEYADLFKSIYKVNVKTEIDNISKEVDVTTKPFSIYISGMDSYGDISGVSRSDVNMVVTINPTTKQILLISIPRDYYVQLRGTTGYKDKLTHAGSYGIETSIGTIEDLLEMDINYYFRVNFSTLEKAIDSIGGVDVYSKYNFTSSPASGGTYRFSKGYNHMNGNMALAFSRERKALPGGDRDRGTNQQAVIDGIVRKATSSAIITKYSSILNNLKNTFQTNMSENDLTSLIKMQLDDMAKWTITSHSLDGSDGSEYTYSYQHQKLYVMKPNLETVTKAVNLVNKIENGEKLDGSYSDNVGNINNPTPVVPKPETPKPETPKPETPKPEPTPEPTPKTYTITFNTSGGGNITSQTVKENELATAPTKPTKEGYDFSHWEYQGKKFSFDTKITENITLVAVWTKKEVIDPIDPTKPVNPPSEPTTPETGTN